MVSILHVTFRIRLQINNGSYCNLTIWWDENSNGPCKQAGALQTVKVFSTPKRKDVLKYGKFIGDYLG